MTVGMLMAMMVGMLMAGADGDDEGGDADGSDEDGGCDGDEDGGVRVLFLLRKPTMTSSFCVQCLSDRALKIVKAQVEAAVDEALQMEPNQKR